ncbi:large conductance mechanosensitive channel protein MscL [Sandaracinus amylolyticus]|uniref:large conductance mechanosensitive channel protein MscL n=1 Tax=Sandaracinus amylolyticus TaxID=927083 RepID=UPI001F028DF3|nr:large conductance mechanosensitive channel protein MscL [Sandaracinus amylolyticus]
MCGRVEPIYMGMLKELRDFLLRGNVLDLAVAFVMGAAFTRVVTAFTEGILMALVAAAVGEPNFDDLAVDLNGTPIRYGVFLTALVSLLLVGTALFVVVKGVNALRRPTPAAPVESDHDVLVQIRDALRTPTPTM